MSEKDLMIKGNYYLNTVKDNVLSYDFILDKYDLSDYKKCHSFQSSLAGMINLLHKTISVNIMCKKIEFNLVNVRVNLNDLTIEANYTTEYDITEKDIGEGVILSSNTFDTFLQFESYTFDKFGQISVVYKCDKDLSVSIRK